MLVLSGGFFLARLELAEQGHVDRFILAGQQFVNPAKAPPGLVVMPGSGYDTQFYYRLALNPFDLSHCAYGICLDSPAYRIQRIGYPLLSWAASLGHHQAVPAAEGALNILGIGAIALVGALIADDLGRSTWWGMLPAAYWGFVFTLATDLTEISEAAFLLAGVLALRKRRPLLAGLAFAAAVLCKEPAIMVPFAYGVVRAVSFLADRRQRRARRSDLAWAVPAAVGGGWQLSVFALTGVVPVLGGVSSNAGPPLLAMVHAVQANLLTPALLAVPRTPAALVTDLWDLQFLVLAAVVITAASQLGRTKARGYERLGFVVALVLTVSLSGAVWSGKVSLRSLDDVYVLATVVLMGSELRLRSLAYLVGTTWLATAAVTVYYV